ncbi:hypothetical protein CKM354_000153700 [Cercospora kikuchii]|uniref:Tim44-like domain-containing protein n=1 Tax=Cercospora kikuchii TaxID=84275 RepID=A0A9P3FCT2_9PEZI|nr:uncharacterized protein CKM354_000153700 [Cercospora kikuchii]GIZ38114.1 hypothetical protein CKM354_000153700 [Cercospora kikuchii]
MSKRLCLSLLSAPQRTHHEQTCRLLLQRQQIWNTTTALDSDQTGRLARSSCRSFSSTACQRVGINRMAGRPQQKPQQSITLQQKQAMKKMQASGEHLDHVGLLEGTFVPPTGEKLPSLFSDPRGRWKVVRYQFKSWLGIIQSRLTAFWFVKPRLKLEVGKTPRIAKELYEEMYAAFANGNMAAMQGKVAPGLLRSLNDRIAQRTPNTHLQWKLHKYIGSPECVSYKFAMPEVKGPNTTRTGLMQAVVKIKSQQSLLQVKRQRMRDPATKQQVVAEMPIDRNGKEIQNFDREVEEKKNMKTMVEYFVIERLLIKGQLGSWRAWGTTQEADLAKLLKAENEKHKALMGGESPMG